MEQIGWPQPGMRITFLTEGPNTPLPPPETEQVAYRLPIGTRVVALSGSLGFLVYCDGYPPRRIGIEADVTDAPLENAGPLIEARAHTMDGSDVLRFGALKQDADNGP